MDHRKAAEIIKSEWFDHECFESAREVFANPEDFAIECLSSRENIDYLTWGDTEDLLNSEGLSYHFEEYYVEVPSDLQEEKKVRDLLQHLLFDNKVTNLERYM